MEADSYVEYMGTGEVWCQQSIVSVSFVIEKLWDNFTPKAVICCTLSKPSTEAVFNVSILSLLSN